MLLVRVGVRAGVRDSKLEIRGDSAGRRSGGSGCQKEQGEGKERVENYLCAVSCQDRKREDIRSILYVCAVVSPSEIGVSCSSVAVQCLGYGYGNRRMIGE